MYYMMIVSYYKYTALCMSMSVFPVNFYWSSEGICTLCMEIMALMYSQPFSLLTTYAMYSQPFRQSPHYICHVFTAIQPVSSLHMPCIHSHSASLLTTYAMYSQPFSQSSHYICHVFTVIHTVSSLHMPCIHTHSASLLTKCAQPIMLAITQLFFLH